ncbi:uncharacterized protein [Ptychodera flava]|uniref:uncharacterized protein n=1 Tax=Ptychodera flava TaxID=63121 RepID=UPI00396A3097
MVLKTILVESDGKAKRQSYVVDPQSVATIARPLSNPQYPAPTAPLRGLDFAGGPSTLLMPMQQSEEPRRRQPIRIVDDRDAWICTDFILSGCGKGSRCEKHHCPMPYQWVLDYDDDVQPLAFTGEVNTSLEEAFCDVTKTGITVQGRFCNAPPPDMDAIGEINVNFDGMFARYTKWTEVAGDFQDLQETFVGIRRLSTPSYAIDHSSAMDSNLTTSWKWYWQDNGNTWVPYSNNSAVSVL